jgi:mediator of RNA polymerase II transcription subunit 21
MSSSVAYLTSRSNFVQVSPQIPITKQRNPEKYDPPDVFEGTPGFAFLSVEHHSSFFVANKKELVTDLLVKAKQIEYLIQSLPEPEAEEVQVGDSRTCCPY